MMEEDETMTEFHEWAQRQQRAQQAQQPLGGLGQQYLGGLGGLGMDPMQFAALPPAEKPDKEVERLRAANKKLKERIIYIESK